jgi:ABC-2 type transport system permease protein
MERVRGTLVRLRSAPIRLYQILAGKALACFLTINGALIALFFFFYLVFHVRPNSYLLLALAFLASSFSFVGIMMLISVMGKTEASVSGIGWAILVVMAMIGGGMIPLAMMPSWMQTVSHFSFVKWAVLAMEGAIWRNFSFNEMLLPVGILFAIGLISFLAGTRIFTATVD